VKEMLTGVITAGTGKEAQLEGFSAAGKTGTAQKIEANGRYSHSRFISSFVGFAPLDNPAIAVVVTIDEPHGQYYGGLVAAPVFRNIAEKTLRYLSVPPDQPLTAPQLAKLRREETETNNPDLEQPELADSEWQVPAVQRASAESRGSTSPIPSPNEEAYNNVDMEGANSIEVPDLRGKSLRTVLFELSKLGLQAKANGSGLATDQIPPPGTKVVPGSKISIQLNRHIF